MWLKEVSERMAMKSVLPFIGMVIVQVAMVGQMMTGKVAMLDGMTNFTFVFYSSAVSFLILAVSSVFYRKTNGLPPFTYSVFCRCILFGLLGFLVQITGYTGIKYASPTLATSMLNLIPGFTFILTVIFRLETADLRSSSSQAKLIGTVVSILGAFIITLYQGPRLSQNTTPPKSTQNLTQSHDWIIGGLLLGIDSVLASSFVIAQALILKRYPSKLVTSSFYSLIIAISSAVLALIVDRDLSSWSLRSNVRIMAVLYAGLFGASFQVMVSSWCLQKTGPLFVVMFHPLGIIISAVMGVIFLGDAFYLGSLVGSIVVIVGVYTVIWGIAKGSKAANANSMSSPLLQDDYVVEDTMVLEP